jgi:hypothetical protein
MRRAGPSPAPVGEEGPSPLPFPPPQAGEGYGEGLVGEGSDPMQRILVHLAGSVDADRCAESLADRTVEHEVGDCVEAGWLAVDDYQGRAVVFRQFREGGGGIDDQ